MGMDDPTPTEAWLLYLEPGNWMHHDSICLIGLNSCSDQSQHLQSQAKVLAVCFLAAVTSQE